MHLCCTPHIGDEYKEGGGGPEIRMEEEEGKHGRILGPFWACIASSRWVPKAICTMVGYRAAKPPFWGEEGWAGHYPYQNMNKAMHTGKVRKSWKNQSNESRLLYLHKRYRSSVGRKKGEVVPFLHKVESSSFCYEQKRKNFSFPFFFHPFFLLSALSFLHFVPPLPVTLLLFLSSFVLPSPA